jgi:hypothetical protein
MYVCQMCVSWPFRPGFFGHAGPIEFPESDRERLDLARAFARTWAEPFQSLVLDLPDDTEVKTLDLADWAPPKTLRGSGSVVLMGDAMHQMAMCKFRRPGCRIPSRVFETFCPAWGPLAFQACSAAVPGPLVCRTIIKG